MSLLLALIIGLIVGGTGGFLLQESFDLLLMNSLMGIAGSVLGGALFFLASSDHSLLFTWGGTLSQIVGALLFVLLFSLLHRATPDKVDSGNTDGDS